MHQMRKQALKKIQLGETPLIGGHVSAAGGAVNAIVNGERIGATCIQIFGSSPRQWTVALPSPAAIAAFIKRRKLSGIKDVYLHAPYLVNIASPIVSNRTKSVAALIGHLQIAEALGAEGLIFHVGSGGELPKAKALVESIRSIKAVLRGAPGRAALIIENSAGGGAKLASLPQDIAAMMEGVNSSRVKVCYDTAHAFEAGIIDAYTAAAVKKHFDEWDAAVGLESIVAIHANDSMTAFNSHHDRHENIGKGYIGLAGFKALAAEKRLRRKAWLLEVPGFENQGPDKKNIELLKKCFL